MLKIISRKDKNLMSQCSAIPRRLPVFVFICDFYLMSMAFGPCTFLQAGLQAAHTPGLGMEQSLHWVLMFTPQLGAQTTGNLVGPDTHSDPLGSPVSLARNLGCLWNFIEGQRGWESDQVPWSDPCLCSALSARGSQITGCQLLDYE